MRKLILTALLMAVAVCFTGCGGNMSMPQQQNATHMSNMQMGN